MADKEDQEETKPNAVAGGEAAAGAGGDDEYIKLRVVAQDNSEVHFRVKASTAMGKLKKSYADRMGVTIAALRFLFDVFKSHSRTVFHPALHPKNRKQLLLIKKSGEIQVDECI